MIRKLSKTTTKTLKNTEDYVRKRPKQMQSALPCPLRPSRDSRQKMPEFCCSLGAGKKKRSMLWQPKTVEHSSFTLLCRNSCRNSWAEYRYSFGLQNSTTKKMARVPSCVSYMFGTQKSGRVQILVLTATLSKKKLPGYRPVFHIFVWLRNQAEYMSMPEDRSSLDAC